MCDCGTHHCPKCGADLVASNSYTHCEVVDAYDETIARRKAISASGHFAFKCKGCGHEGIEVHHFDGFANYVTYEHA